MNNKLDLNFIKDIPLNNKNSGYFKFYHEYVAPALDDIITKGNIYTVGLFGKWGTGKSSIVEILKKDSKHPVLVFDTWKYQNDPLRRTFLLRLFRYINEEDLWKKGAQLPKDFLDDLYESVSVQAESTPLKESEKNISHLKKWLLKLKIAFSQNLLLFGLIGFALSWLLLQLRYGEENPYVNAVLSLVGIIAQSASVATLLGWGLKRTFDALMEKLIKDLTGGARSETIIRNREFLNSPEQFEEKFKIILNSVGKKVVVVFDNVDRVPGKAAIEVLSSIKTFFEPHEATNIIFIVPCDYESISKQIVEYHEEQDPNEFLGKLFSVVIRTPEFINADLEDYARALIQTSGEDKRLLTDDDVIYIIKQAYGHSPRQIKQFINNLIAELYVASKTEVWDIIKDNTGYLAKVLVLKQSFPTAYERLKTRWSTPEDIQGKDTEPENELRAFMENTRTITTINASPFIYYKKPVRARNVSKSEDIEIKLTERDYISAQEIISENSDFEAVVSWVLALMGQYSQLLVPLYGLVIGSLECFSNLGKKSSQSEYYNEVAGIINKDLWKDYLTFPTQKIFSYLINNEHLKSQQRQALIERYVSVLDSDELKNLEASQNRAVLLSIIESLREYKKWQTKDDKNNIAKYVQMNYSTDYQILDIFKTEDDINDYLTHQTINNVTSLITFDTIPQLAPLIIRYRNRILSSDNQNALIQKFSSSVKEETSISADYRIEKQILFESIIDILSQIQDLLNEVSGDIIDDFAKELVLSTRQIVDPDNRRLMIIALQFLYPNFTIVSNEISVSARREYLTKASQESIKHFFEFEKENNRANAIVVEDLAHILPIMRAKPEYREIYYEAVDDEETKTAMLIDLIDNTPNLGLDFLATRQNIAERQRLISLMLDRLSDVPLMERANGYNWIVKQIKERDSAEIKSKVLAQMTNLLKSENSEESSIGFNIYVNATFISITKRRDVAQEILDWLRDPSHTLSVSDRFAMKAVVFAATKLDLAITPIRDFGYFLLKHIRPEISEELLRTFLESLVELSPQYSSGKQSFEDVFESLDNWENGNTKKLVIEEMMKIKPSSPRGMAKVFWEKINRLLNEV